MPITKAPADTRVLLVDDMQSMRSLIKIVLRQFGLDSVNEVSDGEKAIERLKNRPYDLVICDWDMPKVTGLQVLQFVRGQPAIRELPFIMLTANAQGDAVQKAIAAGVTDYITKPFKPDLLMAKIDRLFAKPRPG